MDTLIHALETALPVFATLMLGTLLREKRMLRREGVDALKALVVNITLPMVLFSAFATADYSRNSIAIPVMMYILCVLALALGFLARKFLKTGRLTPYLVTGFEAGMLGYAFFTLLFAGEKNSSFAIIDLGQVLFVFTLYKILLGGKAGLKNAARDALRSPVLWAIAAGLIVGASGLYDSLREIRVSGIIDSITAFLSAPTSAVILLTVGYDLSFRKIRWGNTMGLVGLRLLIMGLMLGLAMAINRWLLGGVVHIGALILMFILPPPFVLSVFADAGDELADISSVLSVSTLLSIALFALMSVVI